MTPIAWAAIAAFTPIATAFALFCAASYRLGAIADEESDMLAADLGLETFG